jgi:hypothetical protein
MPLASQTVTRKGPMMLHSRAVTILTILMLLLSIAGLTGCSRNQIVLQGNQAVPLQQGDSAPYSGWLLGNEALARILEEAERCQTVK